MPPFGIPKLQHQHYTADTRKFRQGNISPPSFKTTLSHEIIPPRSPPPPACNEDGPTRQSFTPNVWWSFRPGFGAQAKSRRNPPVRVGTRLLLTLLLHDRVGLAETLGLRDGPQLSLVVAEAEALPVGVNVRVGPRLRVGVGVCESVRVLLTDPLPLAWGDTGSKRWDAWDDPGDCQWCARQGGP